MAFEDMIILARGEKRFGVRAAAAIVHEHQILLQTAENDDFWVLPGGHAEAGEAMKDCVTREMREELGEEVRLERLLWVVDNFFRYGKADWHEIGFYWLASLAADSPLSRRESFSGVEETGVKFLCCWHDLGSLPALRLYPSFLRDGLRALPQTPQYLVHRDGASWQT